MDEDSDDGSLPSAAPVAAVAAASNARNNPIFSDDDDDDDMPPPSSPVRSPRRRLQQQPTSWASPVPQRRNDDRVPATPVATQGSVPGTPLSPLMLLEDEEAEDPAPDDAPDDAGDAENASNNATAGVDEQVHIRGTDVHVPTAANTFSEFLRTFKSLDISRREQESKDDDDDDDDDDSLIATLRDEDAATPALYERRLAQLLTAAASGPTVSLDLDCMHLYYHNPECQKLYHQMVAYPMEIIPLFDLVLAKELQRIQQEEQQQQDQADDGMEELPQLPRVQVRPFHLQSVANLRCLDPVRMDTLLSIKGMIVRTSPIIPDLKMAHFACSICGNVERVAVDRGRLAEPNNRCPTCSTRHTYTLVHNQSVFADKQLCKIQETPDQVPAGQTPAAVTAFLFDSLVDQLQPGSRVEITGVLRAQPHRVNPKISKLKSVYHTYIDAIHVRTIAGLDHHRLQAQAAAAGTASRPAAAASTTTTSLHPHERTWTPERIAQLRAIATRPDIYDQLTASLAPSIWELDNVKKGILCMLFGGNHVRVQNSDPANDDSEQAAEAWLESGNASNDGGADGNTQALNKRGDINILLCGDPGTSKSQLLSYVHKLTPRGVYTSGKGSSAVGLTASVVRDTETKDLVLESGALVLSDQGICCIDEFDKMSDTTRSVLHEAMEQQTVSIAKAGILATLHARTSVLASANPTESRYNPHRSVVDNIQLPPTLLSRFDLIYLILDSPNVEQDRRLAQHLVGLYYETPNVVKPPIDQSDLQDYIAYARDHIHPQLSDDAAYQLEASYLELRNPPGGGAAAAAAGRTITATPRQLESLIRLSEALAKMRFADTVTREDALEAVRLLRVATQAAATDPRTGRIDMDMITTGRSAADRQQDEQLQITLTELMASRRGGRLTVREIARQLAEVSSSSNNSNNPMEGTAPEFSHQAIVEALRQLEADGAIQFNERAQTIQVRSRAGRG